MTALVVDASVAIKWVVQEAGTPEALALRKATLLAPDLLVLECANILWKKHKLGQLTVGEASAIAQLLDAPCGLFFTQRQRLRSNSTIQLTIAFMLRSPWTRDALSPPPIKGSCARRSKVSAEMSQR